MRRSYSCAWANAGAFQTLLTSGPGTLVVGMVPCIAGHRAASLGSARWSQQHLLSATTTQLSPDLASCSLRVKSLPPPRENPRVPGNNCFQLREQEGAGAGPLQGEVTRPSCAALTLTLRLAGRHVLCVQRGPRDWFPLSGRCWQILRMTRLLRAVKGDDTCGCLD